MIVLDDSALLAWMYREPGHKRVFAALPQSVMTTVNLSEVLARFVRDSFHLAEIGREVAKLPIEWIDFYRTLAAIAAGLAPQTREVGLSFGDRVCLALGAARSITIITGDRA